MSLGLIAIALLQSLHPQNAASAEKFICILGGTGTRHAIPVLAQTFGLTKPERLLLINAPVGEGILIARGSRAALRIVGSAEEDRLART